MNYAELTSVMWRMADLVRVASKRGTYLYVIRALTGLLRQLECLLARTKPKVLAPPPLISEPTY